MKQTEIDYEEKEVERIYCDECSDECTNDHSVDPKHVCRSCDGGRFDRVEEMMDHLNETANTGSKWLDIVFLVILLPITVLLLIIFSFDDEVEATSIYWTLLTVIGSCLWTAMIFLLIL